MRMLLASSIVTSSIDRQSDLMAYLAVRPTKSRCVKNLLLHLLKHQSDIGAIFSSTIHRRS
jgi:hypothetical protein